MLSLIFRLSEACAWFAASFLFLCTTGYAFLYRGILRKTKRISPLFALKIVLLAVYLFAVLYVTVLDRILTVTPAGISLTLGAERRWNLIPFYDFFFSGVHGIGLPVRYALLNVLLFVPLGLLLPLTSCRFYGRLPVFFCGFSFSLLIESLQLVCRSGIFELDDLLFNTAGAMAGRLLFLAIAAHCGLAGKPRENPRCSQDSPVL